MSNAISFSGYKIIHSLLLDHFYPAEQKIEENYEGIET